MLSCLEKCWIVVQVSLHGLIGSNCIIIGRAEAFASRQPLWAGALDGFSMGIGFTAVLLLLGSMREVIGSGTLFADAHLLFGDWAKEMIATGRASSSPLDRLHDNMFGPSSDDDRYDFVFSITQPR